MIKKWLTVLGLLLVGFFLDQLCGLLKSSQPKTKAPCFAVAEHKAFVFVIPSYNNRQWVEKNLRSIFEQRYDNFRILYIDDASTDGTLEQVVAFTKEQGQEHRLQVWHNESNRGAVENIYRAVHSCEEREIVVLCDGDDWLAHDKVLQKLNEKYANPSVWATYGSYIEYPSYTYTVGNFAQPLPSAILKKHSIREFTKKHWYLSHMHTFYAGLFKKIQLKDLLKEGKYFDATYDVAFMIPLVEMAQDHVHYMKEILYIYNRASLINDDKVRPNQQQEVKNYILSLSEYAPIESPFAQAKELGVQLIAFSFDRPMQLYAFLESLTRYGKNVDAVSVLCRASSQAYLNAYEEVRNAFPHVTFTYQKTQADFKPLLMQLVSLTPSPYVTCAVDDIILTDAIDFAYGAQMLEKTGAYSFVYRLGSHVDYCYTLNCPQEVPHLVGVSDDVFAWPFDLGKADWKYQNSLDLALYRKADLFWETLSFTHPNSLEEQWDISGKKHRLGLCHNAAKMVNIPLNIVNTSHNNRHMLTYSAQDLLEKFQKGLKIDIAPLHCMRSRSAHVEVDVQFVER